MLEEARGDVEAAEDAYVVRSGNFIPAEFCAVRRKCEWGTSVSRLQAAERLRLEKLGGPEGAEPDQLLLRIRMGIVGVLDDLGLVDEAEQLCDEVVQDQLQVLGPDHPDTLRSQMSQANFHAAAGANANCAHAPSLAATPSFWCRAGCDMTSVGLGPRLVHAVKPTGIRMQILQPADVSVL